MRRIIGVALLRLAGAGDAGGAKVFGGSRPLVQLLQKAPATRSTGGSEPLTIRAARWSDHCGLPADTATRGRSHQGCLHSRLRYDAQKMIMDKTLRRPAVCRK